MAPFSKDGTIWLLVSEVDCGRWIEAELSLGLKVFEALGVDDRISEALSAEGTHKLKLLEFSSVSVDQLRPLVHLVARFFVELILVEVILPLQLLRQSPDDVVFELEEFALFFVVLEKRLAFCQLPRQVVWEYFYVNFELLSRCKLQVLVQLSIPI